MIPNLYNFQPYSILLGVEDKQPLHTHIQQHIQTEKIKS